MEPIYISYICNRCKGEFVLLKEQLNKFTGKISCPYCDSRNVKKQTVGDVLKECMQERSYKRVNGALREKR